VFCFTPKGRLIALPRGANSIDFAYAVHTDIGNTCVGCKINGRPMPLVTELRNGDEVEIVCSEAQAPPSAWQSLAVTGKARSAIRRATRDAARAQYGTLGREILERAFTRRGKSFSEESIGQALGRLSQKTTEDVIAAVGRGELSSTDLIRAVWPGETSAETPKRRRMVKRTDEGWFGLGKVMGLKFRWPGSSGRSRPAGASSIPIRGLQGDLPVSFADNGAVPGDRIVGILNPGQGITIYPIHARALKAFDEEPERWIDVTWDIDEDNPQRFPAKIAVVALNEPGSLAQLATVIGEADGNIDNIKMTKRVADYAEMVIELEVWDLKHLNEILAGLRAKDVVSSAARVSG
jgi:GTP diphosphokinase / guanosine-3',5'-bis(diphosphate) 3'-diphosphatase